MNFSKIKAEGSRIRIFYVSDSGSFFYVISSPPRLLEFRLVHAALKDCEFQGLSAPYYGSIMVNFRPIISTLRDSTIIHDRD